MFRAVDADSSSTANADAAWAFRNCFLDWAELDVTCIPSRRALAVLYWIKSSRKSFDDLMTRHFLKGLGNADEGMGEAVSMTPDDCDLLGVLESLEEIRDERNG